MLSTKFKFFDVNKCGYYTYRSKSPKFGGLIDTLSKLATWAGDGREFINTATYEPSPEDNKLRTLYCDCVSDSNSKDTVLVLWNEVTNHGGTIYGIEPMQKPGTTEMLHTEFSKEAIPGFPSYFWFIPSRNLVASVKFEHSTIGKGNLDDYILGFMQWKTPYQVNAKEKIIGHAVDGKSLDPNDHAIPRFIIKPRKQLDLETELLTNISRITKIIKTQKLNYQLPKDKKFLELFFDGFNIRRDNETLDLHTAVQDTQELLFRPTEDQLKRIIHSFNESNFEPSIKKIAFGYSDGTRITLNGTSASFSSDIAVTYKENTIITASKLLSALNASKLNILANLDSPNFTKDIGD